MFFYQSYINSSSIPTLPFYFQPSSLFQPPRIPSNNTRISWPGTFNFSLHVCFVIIISIRRFARYYEISCLFVMNMSFFSTWLQLLTDTLPTVFITLIFFFCISRYFQINRSGGSILTTIVVAGTKISDSRTLLTASSLGKAHVLSRMLF